MIDIEAIGKILADYSKHGWILRRVLLSADSGAKFGEQTRLFRGIKIKDSDIDAAWFSRPSANGGVPWELRYLGNKPFALVENIDEKDADFEESLSAVEARLRKSVLNFQLDNAIA